MNAFASGRGRQPHLALSQQRGFTLIEVLIVFFVLSVGLLGMAALQMRSMQYNQSSSIRSQATVAAYDMFDRMRVNSAAAAAGDYDTLFADALPAIGTVAETDILEWKTFLATTLPKGQGQIDCTTAAGECTVSIQWTDRMTGATITTPMSITVRM